MLPVEERQAVQLPVRMQALGEPAGSGAEHGVRVSGVLPQNVCGCWRGTQGQQSCGQLLCEGPWLPAPRCSSLAASVCFQLLTISSSLPRLQGHILLG